MKAFVNGKNRVSILGAVEPARKLPSLRRCKSMCLVWGKSKNGRHRETDEVNSEIGSNCAASVQQGKCW